MAGKPKAQAKPAAKAVAKPAPKPAAKPAAKAAPKAVAKPAPRPAAPPLAKPPAKALGKRVAFPKKNLPPSETEFAARLPQAVGKRFETVRGFLNKQPGVSEELYYYGPKTGWAYRYQRGPQSLCSIVIHDDRLVGIVALDAVAQTAIVWEGLSPLGQKARKVAHGAPTLIWVDVPFEGPGAKDFQAMLKAKLRTLPPPAPSAAR